MRKQVIPISAVILSCLSLVFTSSCKEKGLPKPEHLISEKKMVNILYDLHISGALAERYRNNRNADSLVLDSKALYQSVLNKYDLKDSVLAKSIVFYSTYPKLYERIYKQVVERMNMEQEAMRQHEDIKVPKKE